MYARRQCTVGSKIGVFLQNNYFGGNYYSVVLHLSNKLTLCSPSSRHAAIKRAVSEWRHRLHACVRAKNGHFQHML